METKLSSSFWWLRKEPAVNNNINLVVPRLELETTSSLADFLENEQNALNSNREDASDIDVGSIIEEINRVAAQSPLGPYEQSGEERSIEDIMREAERIYMESSKSFEQLSQRSKTSQNITELDLSKVSDTPTPKSVSPLPPDCNSDSETYSEDFADESDKEEPEKVTTPPPVEIQEAPEVMPEKSPEITKEPLKELETFTNKPVPEEDSQIVVKDEIIKTLEEDNKSLRHDLRTIRGDLAQTTVLLQQTKAALSAKSLVSPEINLEFDKVVEELKDTKEINTALQLQIDTINKTHCLLKNSYDDLLSTNKMLERRTVELDSNLSKFKLEFANLQNQRDKLQANEVNLGKLLEIEKLQSKSHKLQNEKDSKCIQDLNRQIKEMERIIARKHPDSVSALIVAAKSDVSDTNLTARKLLEDRIKTLEEEASTRDSQSSRVFLDVQEKFNQMKSKYENHIEDLELHVNDLKQQLKRKIDTFDVYTQTVTISNTVKPQKDNLTVGCQTDLQKSTLPAVKNNVSKIKEDSHLVATIRGLRTDLSNKEKVLMKLQRELDEVKKTNRKLQKEREGSLKSLTDKREFRSYPEKLSKAPSFDADDETKLVRDERDKIKSQLCRMEEDFQALKMKRLHDLNTLQEAHEREMANYVMNVAPLREQLELQQSSISNLEKQLTKAREELIVVTLERDHLNQELEKLEIGGKSKGKSFETSSEIDSLKKKVAFFEKRYEERELRLRSIIHGLAQKSSTNRGCEFCVERQQQLIGYKVELDQLLEALKTLK